MLRGMPDLYSPPPLARQEDLGLQHLHQDLVRSLESVHVENEASHLLRRVIDRIEALIVVDAEQRTLRLHDLEAKQQQLMELHDAVQRQDDAEVRAVADLCRESMAHLIRQCRETHLELDTVRHENTRLALMRDEFELLKRDGAQMAEALAEARRDVEIREEELIPLRAKAELLAVHLIDAVREKQGWEERVQSMGAEHKEELKQLSTDNVDLRTRLALFEDAAEADIMDFHRRDQALAAELERLQAELAQKTSSCEVLTNEKTAALADRNAQQARCDSLSIDLAAALAEAKRAKTAADAAETQSAALKASLDATVSDRNETYAKAEACLASTEAENRRLATLEVAAAESERELTRKIDALCAEVDQGARVVAQIQRECDERVAEAERKAAVQLETLRAAYEKQNVEVRDAQSTFANEMKDVHTRALVEAKQEIEQLQRELAALRRDHAAQVAELKETHNAQIMQVREGYVGQAAETKETLTGQLAQMRETHAAQVQELKDAHAVLVQDMKEAHTAQLSQTHESYAEKAAQLVDAHAAQVAQLREAQSSDAAHVLREHQSLSHDRAELRDRVRELQLARDSAVEKYEAAREELTSIKQSSKHLAAELAGKCDASAAQTVQINTLTTELRQREMQLSAIKEEVVRLKTMADEGRASNHYAIDTMRNDLQMKERALQEMLVEVNRLKQVEADHHASVESGKLQTLQREVQDERLQKLEAALRAEKDRCTELHRQNVAIAQEKGRLAATVQRYKLQLVGVGQPASPGGLLFPADAGAAVVNGALLATAPMSIADVSPSRPRKALGSATQPSPAASPAAAPAATPGGAAATAVGIVATAASPADVTLPQGGADIVVAVGGGGAGGPQAFTRVSELEQKLNRMKEELQVMVRSSNTPSKSQ